MHASCEHVFAVCLATPAPTPAPVTAPPVTPTAPPVAPTTPPVTPITCMDLGRTCNADDDCCAPYDCATVGGSRGEGPCVCNVTVPVSTHLAM